MFQRSIIPIGAKHLLPFAIRIDKIFAAYRYYLYAVNLPLSSLM